MQEESKNTEKKNLLAVIRIRGKPGIREKFERTLELLNLNKPNHATLVPSTPSYKGMLQKIRHLIAWGEPNFSTVLRLVRDRGELVNGKEVNEETITEVSNGKYGNVKDFVEEIWERKDLKEFNLLKPVFRLHSPSKGFKSTKKSFGKAGSHGNWGKEIDNLLKRMI